MRTTQILAMLIAIGLVLAGGNLAAAKRVALVVGNDAYISLPSLKKAGGDARAMRDVLMRLGFAVSYAENLDFRSFVSTFARFEANVSADDEVIIHYSGHGISIGGRNYLLPVDLEEPAINQTALVTSFARDAGEMVEAIGAKKPSYVFAIFDACRNSPFTGPVRSTGLTRGLVRMEPEPGEFILFSAGPGESALDRLGDGDRAPTSVFTRILLKHIETPGLTLQKLAKLVQREVRELTRTVNHRQFPDYSDRLSEEPIINAGLSAQPAVQPQTQSVTPTDRELSYLLAARDGSITNVFDFVHRFPEDPRAPLLLRAKKLKPSILVDLWHRENGQCRGGSSEVENSCNARIVYDKRLDELDWCYGKRGQYGYQMEWHTCGPDSERSGRS